MIMRKATISAQESWDHEELHPGSTIVRIRRGVMVDATDNWQLLERREPDEL